MDRPPRAGARAEGERQNGASPSGYSMARTLTAGRSPIRLRPAPGASSAARSSREAGDRRSSRHPGSVISSCTSSSIAARRPTAGYICAAATKCRSRPTRRRSRRTAAMGSVYGYITPKPPLSRAPNVWHSYDITFVGRTVTVVADGRDDHRSPRDSWSHRRRSQHRRRFAWAHLPPGHRGWAGGVSQYSHHACEIIHKGSRMDKREMSRREFVRRSTAGRHRVGGVALLSACPTGGAAMRPVAASDRVRFGMIGIGMRGSGVLDACVRLPGVECVAACDL